jgi:hypothetical protein
MPIPKTFTRSLLTAAALASASPAGAIPAFARKYGTSCLTCHTAYPKLTPFGEAFRRNGYRFPGVDSDYVKQETVPLGQEQNKKTFPDSVWPATIPVSVPVAIGANGAMTVYPDKTASVPRQNNGTQFALDDLVAEGHLWAGAALDDTITLWAELTIAGGGAEVEHAQVLFNDLLGPKHLVNLVVGKGFPTLSSFGAHSSYIADQGMANAPVSAMFLGSGDPFVLVDNVTGLELNGVVEGRVDYSLGLTSGKNNSTFGSFNSENWYAHAGFKLGGMRLDGEGSTGAEDPLHPWAETALTVDGYYYHSSEHLDDLLTGPALGPVADVVSTAGVHARGQLGSLELNLGYYAQDHGRGWVNAGLATPDYAKVSAGVFYSELSYVVFPWLIPAIRVESISLKPSGGTSVSDLHVMPGIAFLIRPNLKLVVAGNIESTDGFPVDPTGAPTGWQGGAADWGSFVASPVPNYAITTRKQEFESLAFFLAWAI